MHVESHIYTYDRYRMDVRCALEAKDHECDEKFGNHVNMVRIHQSLEKVGS